MSRRGIRGVEQHALEAIRQQRRRERCQQSSVEWLMEIGADQPDDVGARVDEALREPVDAIAEAIRRPRRMRSRISLDTLAPGVNVRETAERETPARSRNVGGGDERSAQRRLAHCPVFGLGSDGRFMAGPLHTCASS